MYQLIYNNKPFSDFSTFYDGSQQFITPRKDIEKVSIQGRNGDLTFDNKRFENVIVPFNCFIRRDFINNYNALMNFLYSQKGYGRIETSEEPDVYRMGLFVESVEPNTHSWLHSGAFTVEFDCMPQKWLKSGDIGIEVTDSVRIQNPTQFEAKPLIAVQGTGTIRINNQTMTLTTNTGTTYIDCEIQDVYEGTINRNPNFTYTGDDFPVLEPGVNGIDVDGCTIEIYPRWWRI